MCSHSSPDRERRTVPLKRSTADSSIYAGPRWDSATSRITSRGVCSSPVASDRFYTLNYDEPHKDCEQWNEAALPVLSAGLPRRSSPASAVCHPARNEKGADNNPALEYKKGPRPTRTGPSPQKLLRQSPTLPQPPSCSTISANGLSYRDRNG